MRDIKYKRKYYHVVFKLIDGSSVTINDVLFSSSPWRQDNHLISCYNNIGEKYSFVAKNVLYFKAVKTGREESIE